MGVAVRRNRDYPDYNPENLLTAAELTAACQAGGAVPALSAGRRAGRDSHDRLAGELW
jgi:hypothetical protein